MLCERCQQEIKHPIDQFEGYCHNCEDWTMPGPLGLRRERPIYFNRQGEPIPMSVWAMLIENQMDRIVQQDTIDTDEGPVKVSTVWMGLDMSFGLWDDTTSLIFETMIFGGPADQATDRYATWAEAEQGHERMVAIAREAQAELDLALDDLTRGGSVVGTGLGEDPDLSGDT